MSSQNFWKFVQVKIPQSGGDNQVDHGGHTEQLRLIHRDLVIQPIRKYPSNGFVTLLLTHLRIDLVLLLFLLHGIVNTADNFFHNFVIQVPGNTLELSIRSQASQSRQTYLKNSVPELFNM